MGKMIETQNINFCVNTLKLKDINIMKYLF